MSLPVIMTRGLKLQVRPYVSLYPGPVYVAEGSNVTLPTCHVIHNWSTHTCG